MLVFYVNSIYAIPFSYAAQIMTEREFSLAMMSYSITAFAMTLSSHLFSLYEFDIEKVYTGYIIFFTFTSALVTS